MPLQQLHGALGMDAKVLPSRDKAQGAAEELSHELRYLPVQGNKVFPNLPGTLSLSAPGTEQLVPLPCRWDSNGQASMPCPPKMPGVVCASCRGLDSHQGWQVGAGTKMPLRSESWACSWTAELMITP